MKIWRVKQNGNQYSIDIGNIIIPCQIGKNGLISSKLNRLYHFMDANLLAFICSRVF